MHARLDIYVFIWIIKSILYIYEKNINEIINKLVTMISSGQSSFVCFCVV